MIKTVAGADRRFRPSRLLCLAGIGLSVVTVAAAVVVSWNLRGEAIAHARKEAANLGVALAEETARSLQAADLVLQEVLARIPAAAIDDAGAFERLLGTREIHRFLKQRLNNLPQAQAIGVIGSDGRFVNSSRSWPAPDANFADRDHYQHFRDSADAGVYISTPVIGRVIPTWSFFLARRITGRNGEFCGIVTAVIEIPYFEQFYQAIALQQGEAVTVLRRDGVMLARYPHVEKMMGQKLAPQAPFYDLVAKGGGVARTPGYIDGTPRLVSLHLVRGFPLAVTVTVSEDAVLANWKYESIFIAIGALGALVGFALLFRALTAEYRALEHSQSSLFESEARFRDFARTSSDWFWETDAQHRFIFMSEGLRSFGFATEPDHVIGRTRLELAADAGSGTAKWEEHQAALERHEPFHDFVYTWRNPGREGTAAISGVPIFDAQGRFVGYRGTGRDVTREVLADRALREAKAAAETANQAKSQFLANMSHELRTPLNAIIGFSEMIEHGMAGPVAARQREYIGLIRQSGSHLLDIINSILDLSKIDAGKIELYEEQGVDPRQIAETCIALVGERAISRRVRLLTSIDPTTPLLVADSTRLKEILLNLLSNAITFTEAGGSVVAGIRRAEHGGIEFDVRDTGCGMTPAEIEIALEPFGQVDAGSARRHEGTGLGLPLARRLTELHGGSLRVESEKGRGTTVTVVLPAARVLGFASPQVTTVTVADAV